MPNAPNPRTQGSAPTASMPAGTVESALPAGWAEAVDANTGRTYFYNAGTVARTWERPLPDGASGTVQSALPAGWAETVDTSTGRTYFYNTGTGVRTWERPLVGGVPPTSSVTMRQDIVTANLLAGRPTTSLPANLFAGNNPFHLPN